MSERRVGPIVVRACDVCGFEAVRDAPDIAPDDGAPFVCGRCRRSLPPSLIKASVDPFDYAMRLRTGEILRFESASIHGEYVTLILRDQQKHALAYPFERGVDVRLSDVVWCADAPEGS